MEQQSLFRKKSMERIQSPEQLNDYLRVTNPTIWIILIAVILLLVGFLVWTNVTVVNSYVEGSAEVRSGTMTVRFADQEKAKNLESGMLIYAGNSQTELVSVARDENGLFIGHANTLLPDGFYQVRVQYSTKKIISFLFN